MARTRSWRDTGMDTVEDVDICQREFHRRTSRVVGRPHWSLTIYPRDGEPGNSKHGGFCKGCYMLLTEVIKTGSLNKACHNLGIAYSKAWRLIKDVEDDFGNELLVGRGVRGSEVTEFGRILLSAYERLLQDVAIVGNDWVR